MALSSLDITREEALKDLGLLKLPNVIKPEDYPKLVDGIALVTKAGGSRNYVRVSGDGEKGLTVTKDYGAAAVIVSIDYVYAKSTLDIKKFMPDMRSNDQIVEYLRQSGYQVKEVMSLLSRKDKSAEQVKADRETVNGYIREASIRFARMKMQEDERVRKMYGHGTE